LDTMLPSAWTSGTPSLVGLWTLRMTVLMAILMIVSLSLEIGAKECDLIELTARSTIQMR
jgi:MATE family multidrug resistance protein